MKKSSIIPGAGFWITLLVITSILVIFKLWSVPSAKQTAPTLVTLEQLVKNPGKYHRKYIVVTDAVVDDPKFLLNRSFFWMSSPKTNQELFAVSPTFRSQNDASNDGIFFFEVLYAGNTYQLLLLREVTS